MCSEKAKLTDKRRGRSPGERQPNIASNPNSMNKLFLIPLILLASCSHYSAKAAINIKSCYDGDTCTSSTGEKIRLACYNTPELRGRSANPVPAKEARDYLRSLVIGQSVEILRYDTDRYGRTVADLFVNGQPIGEEMVRSGHGEVMPRYSSQCEWSS